MRNLWRDIQVGVRSLRKTPLVSLLAVVTLALGIGANSAIFSIVNAVLLQPLPVAHAERIVFIRESSPQRQLNFNPVAPANYLDWKAQANTLSDRSAFGFLAFTYSQSGGAVRVDGAEVDPDFFRVLGVKPVAGRVFTADDNRPGADNVVVVTEGFWKRSLGGQAEAVGRPIRLNSRPFTLIGVVPDRAAQLFFNLDIWKPLGWDAITANDRAQQRYSVIARLREGVDIKAAQTELSAISQHLAQQYPATNTNWTAELTPLLDGTLGPAERQMVLLLAVVALVLLIACVNLASLFSARVNARRREIATRVALGATRGRLMQQFLVESVLLSLAGGLLGIAVAYKGLPLLIDILPQLPRVVEPTLDTRTLLLTFVLAIVAGLFFGLSPGLQASRATLHSELQDSARGSSRGSRGLRLLDGLVISEIALSMVLLVGAGLVLRSFLALRQVDPGFRPDHVLVNTLLVLPTDKYTTSASRQEFFNRLLDRIHTMPNVRAAGGITALPLQGNSASIGFRIAGETQSARGQDRGAVHNIVTEGYFETMGIPLRRGRTFTKSDDSRSPHVAVVNDVLARSYFEGRDPIGQTIFLPGGDVPPIRIVGVVGSSRQFGLRAEPAPEIFVPFLQSTSSYMYVVVRTSGNPEQVAEPIRREVAAIDPDQPVGHRTLERQIDNAVAQPKVLAELLGLFASLALILALVGIYGVTSYGVAQRTQEIGIRMALGANAREVVSLVMFRCARVAVLGVAIGAAAAFGLTHLIAQFLFGIGVTDPVTYLNTGILLLAVAMLAALVPARKASRVDPMIAMRHD